MPGYGNGRAAVSGMTWLYFEMIPPHAPEQRLCKIAGQRRPARTFEYLPAMQSESTIVALHDGHGRKYHVVASAACDDHSGARIQRFDEGLDAHLRDDRPTVVDDLARERLRPQAFERSLAQTALQVRLVDLRADHRHAK